MRASFLREHKKYQRDGKLPKKPSMFCESMLVIIEKQTNTKIAFTSEERETRITFYQNNLALWNHGMLEYTIEIFDIH